ncbi:MAG: MBOAT family protein [Pseudomonadota bacterium]|nr:MBOAT family protein [Pseudomonadota bacterium]
MLFNSHVFLFGFLPLVWCGYFLLARRSHRLASLWLLAASLAFYAYWNPRFVALLLASIVFNHVVGTQLARRTAAQQPTRLLLASAIAVDLVVLAVFKYARFFLDSYAAISGSAMALPEIVLPLGISFYSFTQIAFLVDSARGIVGRVDGLRYALFVTYFPHLIAGPVLHHRQVMPQFERASGFRPQWPAIADGLAMFTLGLSKKLLVADTVADYADLMFNSAAHGAMPNLGLAWGGTLAYSFQLYFDFSGYSDMAIGLSLLFNVRLPCNFDSPYKAGNIIEFWRRWHMTLSQFLRDYLYFPLGGNRHGKLRRHLNLMATMLLGGLWHGANWTFVAWGGLHGAYLVANHLIGSPAKTQPPRAHAVAATFLLVTLAWVPFRSANLACAGQILASMTGLHEISVPAWLYAQLHPYIPSPRLLADGLFGHDHPLYMVADGRTFIFVMVCCSLLVWKCPNSQQLLLENPSGRVPALLRRRPLLTGATLGALLCLDLAQLDHVSTFLYFQF